jgi:hypothetical protein
MTIEERLAELCFSDWKVVKKWLLRQDISIEEVDGVIRCHNPNHNIVVGFDWGSLDYFTRGYQLQFILFGGKHFFELSPFIEKLYKTKKKNK